MPRPMEKEQFGLDSGFCSVFIGIVMPLHILIGLGTCEWRRSRFLDTSEKTKHFGWYNCTIGVMDYWSWFFNKVIFEH